MTVYSLEDHQRLWPDLTLAQRQRLGIEPDGTPLDDDAILGRRTRAGIYLEPDAWHPIVAKCVELALLGARESGGNNCGYWPRLFMNKLTPPHDPAADQAIWHGKKNGLWCAGFGGWVARQVYGPPAPYSWSARQLARLWAAGGERVELEDVQPGDAICWRREDPENGAAGHFGWAAAKTSELLITIEGNGSRRDGAVGVYGYSLADRARRGKREPQDLIIIARRPA